MRLFASVQPFSPGACVLGQPRLGEASLERCRSGRSGRSRKPLCAYAYPGFESLPLRHCSIHCDRPETISHDGEMLIVRNRRVRTGRWWNERARAMNVAVAPNKTDSVRLSTALE